MSVDPESAETIEAAFLEAISAAPLDHAPRYVYADWLEEQLDIRAEYLRVACQWSELSVADPVRDACRMRMQELVRRISPAWLSKVVDVAPMNCPAAKFSDQSACYQCPQRWLLLKPTLVPEIRACSACQKRVHFCATYRNVELAVESGQPIAVEPSLDSTAYRHRCRFDPEISEAAKRKSIGAPDNASSDLANSLANVEMTLAGSSSPPPPSPSQSASPTTVSWLRRLIPWSRQ